LEKNRDQVLEVGKKTSTGRLKNNEYFTFEKSMVTGPRLRGFVLKEGGDSSAGLLLKVFQTERLLGVPQTSSGYVLAKETVSGGESR